MLTIEAFTLFIALCILAPILGALAVLFLLAYENRIDLLEKQKKEMALERDLQEALYIQLNQEIQPHFFFNTLNSMLSLARLGRKEELISGLENFSKLLKHKYITTDKTLSLRKELEYVEYYLAIQRIRFRERLEINWQTEPLALSALTIPYLVQTLVENAFKHAFEKNPGPAHLIISVNRKGSQVQIAVTNNLIVSTEDKENTTGIGLSNLENRLSLLFSKDKVSIENQINGEWITVSISYPFQYWEEREENKDEHFSSR